MALEIYNGVFVTHVVAATLCALAVVVPMVAKKGGRSHRLAGWLFVASLVLTSLSGMIFAGFWFVAPLEVKPMPIDTSPERMAAQAAAYRQFAPFFMGLGVLAGAAAWHGISATRSRRAGASLGWKYGDRVAITLCGVAGVGLAAWGAYVQSILFVAFGLLALHAAYDDRKTIRAVQDAPQLWMTRHLQAMIGGVTVVFTAFVVQAVPRYFGGESFRVWLWMVPVACGFALSSAWTRALRRRSLRPSGVPDVGERTVELPLAG